VHPGLTDGSLTEVSDGDLKEGDQVIVDTIGEGSGNPPGAGAPFMRRLF
jgi:hypothetical protein